MPGHNNYIAGKSIFRGDMAKARDLLHLHGGKQKPSAWKNDQKEFFTHTENIGYHINSQGALKLTNKGYISWSSSVAHIVPSNPYAIY